MWKKIPVDENNRKLHKAGTIISFIGIFAGLSGLGVMALLAFLGVAAAMFLKTNQVDTGNVIREGLVKIISFLRRQERNFSGPRGRQQDYSEDTVYQDNRKQQDYREDTVYQDNRRQEEGFYRETAGDFYRQNRHTDSEKTKTGTGCRPIGKGKLPKSPGRRRKILQKFNRRYDLLLTEEQMTDLVNASYVSLEWRTEIEAMKEDYDVIHQWFYGENGWLRVYLSCFQRQDISGDFEQQKKICLYCFQSVFSYMDQMENLPLDIRIRKVNDHFLTTFDEVSLNVVWKFLEDNGLSFKRPDPSLHGVGSEVDDMVEKYASMGANG